MSFLTSKLLKFSTSGIFNQLAVFGSNSLRSLCTTIPRNQANENRNLPDKKEELTNLFKNINNQLKNESCGRLFAVVQLCGKQFKITQGDNILVEGYWPPTAGDKIRLDKVLLAGCNDFTLIGKPLLNPGVCDVQATVIEKTLSHTRTNFKKKRRKQYRRINFYRTPVTMIRINSIEVNRLGADTKNSEHITMVS